MFRRQSDLLLGILLTLVMAGMITFSLLPPAGQAILAIPFLFFVPGNAIISAIFPGLNLSRLERFLFVIGASLGVIIIGGLALNYTPWGLQTSSLLAILSGISLVASVIAIVRRWNLPVTGSTTQRFHLPGRQVTLFSLTAIVVSFALILTFVPQPPHNIQGYSSLWVKPASETQPRTLLVGIHSQELETTRYNLLITDNGQPVKNWLDISLEPGDQWQESLSMPAGQGLVEADLYRLDSPGVIYRHVSITLTQ